jgi:hypothetical protein
VKSSRSHSHQKYSPKISDTDGHQYQNLAIERCMISDYFIEDQGLPFSKNGTNSGAAAFSP